jgi:hypothetical protein
MKIIEIRPTKKFGGAWFAFEVPGVEPALSRAYRQTSAILVGY